MQSALAPLPAIGAGNVIVGSSNPGGGAGSRRALRVEFLGERYADTNVSQLTIQAGSPNLNQAKPAKSKPPARAPGRRGLHDGCVQGEARPRCPASSPNPGGPNGAVGPAPGALVFDPSGDLWVLSGGRAQRFAPDGGFLGEVPLPADSQTRGLAIDPASEGLYVLGPRGHNETQRVTRCRLRMAGKRGEFTLGFEGESPTTPPFGLPHASAESIQSALEALPSIGEGNVSVEGVAADTPSPSSTTSAAATSPSSTRPRSAPPRRSRSPPDPGQPRLGAPPRLRPTAT